MSTRGVTLLETLVALALTALVLGSLSRSLTGAARSRTLAGTESDRLSAARTVLLRLAAEIEAAVPETGVEVEPDGAPPPASARLRLTTIARTAAGTVPASDRRTVAYELDRTTGTLVRRERAAPLVPDAPALPPVAVLEGVRRLGVRCTDGTDWHDRWPVGSLPRAVAVVLGVDDGRGGVEEFATTATVALGGR